MAAAIAPIPMASFAGQPSSSIGAAFLKTYAAATLVGNCVGEVLFNMLVLVTPSK